MSVSVTEGTALPQVLPLNNVSLAKPRLLVVDDHDHVCRLMTLQLKRQYEVETATSFDEGLKKAAGQAFDGAILDIDLGESRSGLDLLRAIRLIPHQYDLPVLACTAYTVTDGREKSLMDGFNGYVGKPLRRDQLLVAVARILDRERDEEWSSKSLSANTTLSIPPLPATFADLMQVLSREDPVPDTERLVEILNRDSVSSTWILRHVNSAYYSLMAKIASVERAVAMLGFDPVCNLILTQVMTQTFAHSNSPKGTRVYHHVMRASAATAAFSRVLAYNTGLEKPETAFTAGLLHQLGRLILLSTDMQRYVELWQEVPSESKNVPITIDPEDEFREYRTNYARLGAEVGHAWQLHEHLVNTIRYHECPKWTSHMPFHQLTLCVAAGHNAMIDLFEPEEVQLRIKRERADEPNPLHLLANLLRRDEKELKSLIEKQRANVRSFANSIVAG